jgi:predicted nucleic acid-binding protein
MKYIIDSSVGFKWVVPEPDSQQALRLRQHHEQSIHQLLAPDIFPIEIGHALTRAERQKRIPIGAAVPLLTDATNSLSSYQASLLLLTRACEISSKARVGIYDCIYVTLAEKEGCQLVTADDRLIQVLQKDFPFIVSLASIP